MTIQDWPSVELFTEVASPGLLLNLNLVHNNLEKMLEHVNGDAKRLRPHVKTHKMSGMVSLQREVGIEQFKVATLSEASMVASCGAEDVLVAYPIVGPNLSLLGQLIEQYPETTFSCLVDHPDGLALLKQRFGVGGGALGSSAPLGVWVDVDCGMHRTGIEFGDPLDQLREEIHASRSLFYRGLHVYDGHLHQPDFQERMNMANQIKERVKVDLASYGDSEVIVGGSPTFRFWAEQSSWQCSPGTPLFWDQGYGSNYPELGFSTAIALLTRVISKPDDELVCVDLGYKAVAAEMPLDKRVVLPAVPDAVFVGQSEEHLVLRTSMAGKLQLGSELLAFPRHVCPTVALHQAAQVIQDGVLIDCPWRVDARDRLLSSHATVSND